MSISLNTSSLVFPTLLIKVKALKSQEMSFESRLSRHVRQNAAPITRLMHVRGINAYIKGSTVIGIAAREMAP